MAKVTPVNKKEIMNVKVNTILYNQLYKMYCFNLRT